MKATISATLAVLVAMLASPAQALTLEQETCIERIPVPTQDAAYEEYLADKGPGAGYQALARAAEACAKRHNLPADKWEAYVIFANAKAIIRASQEQLVDAGYPMVLFADGLEALSKAKGGAANVFNRKTGITQEGIDFLNSYFARRGARFAPDDDVAIGNLTDILFSLAEIVALAGELDLALD